MRATACAPAGSCRPRGGGRPARRPAAQSPGDLERFAQLSELALADRRTWSRAAPRIGRLPPTSQVFEPGDAGELELSADARAASAETSTRRTDAAARLGVRLSRKRRLVARPARRSHRRSAPRRSTTTVRSLDAHGRGLPPASAHGVLGVSIVSGTEPEHCRHVRRAFARAGARRSVKIAQVLAHSGESAPRGRPVASPAPTARARASARRACPESLGSARGRQLRLHRRRPTYVRARVTSRK